MSLKGKTLVAGHHLLLEGAALGSYRRGKGGEGIGGCSCGARSPILKSGAQRQQWHREHKAEIKAQTAA